MPGGMGGMGGLLRGMMGGRMDATASQPTALSQPEVYDVDRWKRADDIDNTTMVQAVRRDWEQKQARKQTLRQKIKAFFQKKSGSQTQATAARVETVEECTGGTVMMPEMKEAQRRIKTDVRREAPLPPPAPPVQSCRHGENYLGFNFPTALDGFFTANPLNSAILAVDRLAFGPLSLNQVTNRKAEEDCRGDLHGSTSDTNIQ